ncbi:MAG: single-stranded DNA-binding protein [Treponema sp.]
MTDLNTLTIIGRLTHDISEKNISYTAGGTARLNLSIAVNRSQKSGGEWSDKVSFFDVTIWGKTAENIKNYLCKGKQIAVQGYLEQQRWEKGGQKYSKVCIIANQIQLLGDKNKDVSQQEQGYTDLRNDDDFLDDVPF